MRRDRIHGRRPSRPDRTCRQPRPDRIHSAENSLGPPHEPKIYEKTKHILLPKDYIRYRITGDYATEVSDASGTLLLDVVNRRGPTSCWNSWRSTNDCLPQPA